MTAPDPGPRPPEPERPEAAPDVAAIRGGLDEVAGAVALARQALSGGDLVDLSGLDTRIDELCRAILTLPRAAGRSLESALLGLIEDLTRLNESLMARHAAFAAGPPGGPEPGPGHNSQPGTGPRQAASAYRRTQG